LERINPKGSTDTALPLESARGSNPKGAFSAGKALRVPPSVERRRPQGWGEAPAGSARGAGREWPLPVRVKLCGLTREEDARLAWELGAAALGFVFHPGSPRCLTAKRAGELRRALPPDAFTVGVFVDRPADEVNAVAAEVGLDAVQLHGSESPETVAAAVLPVIKALQPADLADEGRLRAYGAALLLLDAHGPGRSGGTGARADWAAAARLARRFPLVLAGGLSPDNAAEALTAVSPFALDLCSGVEASPGVKDPARLRALFDALPQTGGRPCLFP